MLKPMVALDAEVRRLATALRVALNQSSALHLYVNDPAITPGTNPVDILEAGGAGYVPFLCNGLWQAPVKLEAGRWAISGPVGTFNPPTAGGYTCYGCFLTIGQTRNYVQQFAVPVQRNPNGSVLQLAPSLVIADSTLLVIHEYHDVAQVGALSGIRATSHQ